MNIALLIPRRKRKNPNWLMRIAKLVGNFRYFRARGFTVRAAWWNANNTI